MTHLNTDFLSPPRPTLPPISAGPWELNGDGFPVCVFGRSEIDQKNYAITAGPSARDRAGDAKVDAEYVFRCVTLAGELRKAAQKVLETKNRYSAMVNFGDPSFHEEEISMLEAHWAAMMELEVLLGRIAGE